MHYSNDIIDAADLLPALEALDRSACRLTGASSQLYREIERRADAEINPGAAHLKSRLPRVVKSLSVPGEGRAFLDQVTAAQREGRLDQFVARYGTFERWSQQQREPLFC